MEIQFSRIEQEAVAHVLYNLLKADYSTQIVEKECVELCLDEIGFDRQGFSPLPQNELQKGVYGVLKEMSVEKKCVFSRMMTQVSRADGHFGAREKAFVIEILEMCDVPFVHK